MNLATAAAAPSRLRALAGRLRELAAAVHRREPRGLHDLRVTCRRLEVELRLWYARRDVAEAREQVRRLRRAAGPAREQEVVAALLRAGRSGARAIPPAVRAPWIRALEAAVAEAIPHLPGTQAWARLDAQLEHAAAVSTREGDAARALRARTRYRRWQAQARRRLAAGLASGDIEPLHRARLAVKRWRYAEERLAAAGARLRRRELRDWQRRLGDLNDRALLIEFAAQSGPQGQPYVRRLESLRRAAVRRLPQPRAGLSSVRRPQA